MRVENVQKIKRYIKQNTMLTVQDFYTRYPRVEGYYNFVATVCLSVYLRNYGS